MIALALMPTVMLGGCPRSGNGNDESDTVALTMPGSEQDRSDRPEPPVVFVRLHVWIVEVPVGLVSRSEDLWSYLNEEPVGPQRQAMLGRNGLRVGTSPADAWDDIAKLLREMTGSQMRRSELASLPARPIDLVLKQDVPAATIFTSRDDRTLTGADCPGGDYVLTLTATVDMHDPSFVVITAVPQIRSARGRPRYVGDGDSYRLTMTAERTTFENLMFQLPLSENDIMVVGPGSRSRRTTSVGRNFLVRTNEGMSFEKVLVIRPELSVTRR